jgi:hypothetical protein
MHWTDELRRTPGGSGRSYGICCNHGKVQLDNPPEPPDEYRALLEGSDRHSIDFRNNIRQYNAALAFTSLGVDVDHGINQGGHGPYVFRIHGELCHRAGSLLPSSAPRQYAQLYIHDTRDTSDTHTIRDAVDQRMRRNSRLSRDVMEFLTNMLEENHHYSNTYQHAYEILQQHPEAEDPRQDVSIRISATRQPDRRRYNVPTADEVSVILPGDESAPVERRDIILHRRAGPVRQIHEAHPAYAPLHYVLLFPYGTDGWHWSMRETETETENSRAREPPKLTQARFYAYQLFDRPNHYSIVLHGGRLFQQYLVDAWACTEQERMRYLRIHQGDLRAHLYSGLADQIQSSPDVDLHDVGQERTVLPSSFTGGPRYMGQLLQDALAIGRYYKKIDLFITMTANPRWDEIVRELRPGEQPQDRPDLITRVFEMKKRALLDDITKNGIFGRTVASLWTVEFQKRGLPHMHLLIFLAPEHKIHDPADIDSCIRAYWPNPETEPLLFDTVKRTMVHGPCGTQNPRAPCMENGKCTKGFPRAFSDHTALNEDGYPSYFCPEDGIEHQVGVHMVNNSWIVAYNPYLSARYNCHINVECSVSFATLKYLCKYIHKGSDRATIELFTGDEIKKYMDSRYVSACESSFRLFQFKLHAHYPTVERLEVISRRLLC